MSFLTNSDFSRYFFVISSNRYRPRCRKFKILTRISTTNLVLRDTFYWYVGCREKEMVRTVLKCMISQIHLINYSKRCFIHEYL